VSGGVKDGASMQDLNVVGNEKRQRGGDPVALMKLGWQEGKGNRREGKVISSF